MKPAWLLPLALTVALCSTASAQLIDFAKVEIITEKLGPNVYMLTGSGGLDPSHDDAAGGRIGVLAGPDGVLMIDSQYAQLSDKVLAAVRQDQQRPDPLSRQHPHPPRPHRRQRVFRQAGRRDLRARRAARRHGPPVEGAQCREQSGRQSGRLPGRSPTAWAPGVKIHMNDEIVALHSDLGGAHRRRHQHQVREGERAVHRRLLPQLRLSLHRHQQRRLAQGHARRARRHR